MAPINKKIRAIVRNQNANAATTANSPTSPGPSIVTTTASNGSNHTAVITTASGSSSSSAAQGAQTSGNAGSSDSDQADGSPTDSGEPKSDDNNINVVGENCPNLSFVGRPKGSSITIPTTSSVSSQFGKILHSFSQKSENHVNVHINHQYIVPSPSSSPIDPHSRPFSYSASSSSSSLSPSPSTSTQDNFARSSDSPSSIYLYENGTRRRSVISSGGRSSPNTSKKEMNDESLVENHHEFNLRSQFKHDTKNADGNSSSSQSGKITIDKSSEEYRLRRERNNIAVRKSRSKSKIKYQQMIERTHQLEEENSKLHHHIAKMNQELVVLKLLLEKYHDENYKRMLKLDNVDAMDMSSEIRMIDRVEIGSERFQIRNFGNSRSNINPFYSER